jgi:uncharacterized cupin superfamily protein
VTNEVLGSACTFEDEGTPPFGEMGFTLGVLQPGKPSALYHRESNQEDFLVLVGEWVLLIEGEERRLRAWDFVHCPPEAEHIFVGAGDGPCVIFMARGRMGEKRITYPAPSLPSATARAPRPRRACHGRRTRRFRSGSRGRRRAGTPALGLARLIPAAASSNTDPEIVGGLQEDHDASHHERREPGVSPSASRG